MDETTAHESTSDGLQRLLGYMQYTSDEYATFERDGDPSGYGKINVMTWLAGLVLGNKRHIVDAQARAARLDAAREAIAAEIAVCEEDIASLEIAAYDAPSSKMRAGIVTNQRVLMGRRGGLAKALALLTDEGKD